MSSGGGNFWKGFAKFWKRGEPMVWATGAALALMLLMTAVLLLVIAVNGLGVFWPAPLVHADLAWRLANSSAAKSPARSIPTTAGRTEPKAT